MYEAMKEKEERRRGEEKSRRGEERRGEERSKREYEEDKRTRKLFQAGDPEGPPGGSRVDEMQQSSTVLAEDLRR